MGLCFDEKSKNGSSKNNLSSTNEGNKNKSKEESNLKT